MRLKTLLIAVLLLSAATAACDDKASQDDASDVSVADDTESSQAVDDDLAPKQDDAPEPDRNRPTATSPGDGVVSEQPPLDIYEYMDEEQVAELVSAEVSRQSLAGDEPSPSYNATHFQSEDRESFGVGLQLWKLKDREEALARIDDLREQYLNVEEAPEGAPVDEEMAFVSGRAGILSYVFATGDDARGFVAAVSCSEQMCENGIEQHFEIASLMLERIENNAAEKAEAAEAKR
ncbi:MAG: hypothetical protein ACOC9W_04895 [Persicimonas sp.]